MLTKLSHIFHSRFSVPWKRSLFIALLIEISLSKSNFRGDSVEETELDVLDQEHHVSKVSSPT